MFTQTEKKHIADLVVDSLEGLFHYAREDVSIGDEDIGAAKELIVILNKVGKTGYARDFTEELEQLIKDYS